MKRRTATGIALVLLMGLITHCAAQMRVRVRYRVLPQRGPGLLEPFPSQRPLRRPSPQQPSSSHRQARASDLIRKGAGKKTDGIPPLRPSWLPVEKPLWRFFMSMKQLESFLARANGNDNIRREVEQCGGDTACVAKVGLRHGHKFSAANYTRWQREHK